MPYITHGTSIIRPLQTTTIDSYNWQRRFKRGYWLHQKKSRRKAVDGGNSGNDKLFTVSAWSYPLDIDQQWR